MNDHRNWGTISRNYLTAKSKQAGSPLCLNLLPGAPCIFNPCWKAAPSFAACELLAGSGCEASSSSASFSRIFWCLGASNLYFVTATPYEHLASSKHRARQLLPSVVRNVLEAHHQTEAEQKSAESGAIARRTASIMRDLAADMQSWAIRSLGWVLTHTFRCDSYYLRLELKLADCIKYRDDKTPLVHTFSAWLHVLVETATG